MFPVINMDQPTPSPFAGRQFLRRRKLHMRKNIDAVFLTGISRETAGMNPHAGSVLMFAHVHYSTLVASVPLFYP